MKLLIIAVLALVVIAEAAAGGGLVCDARWNAKEQHYCKRDVGCSKHGAGWHCGNNIQAHSCSICGPNGKEMCTGICVNGAPSGNGDHKCNAQINAKEQHYCKRDVGCRKHGAGWRCEMNPEAETCSICGPGANEKCTGICVGGPKCDAQTNAKDQKYCKRAVGCHSHGAGWHCVVNEAAETCSICGPAMNEKCIGFCAQGLIPSIKDCDEKLQDEVFCVDTKGCQSYDPDWKCVIDSQAHCNHHCGMDTHQICQGFCK